MDSQTDKVSLSEKTPKPVASTEILSRTTADPRIRQYVEPSRIVWQSDGVENANSLFLNRSGQITLKPNNPCILKSDEDGGSILLDFGKELHGGVQIMVWDTKDNQPVKIRVRFGESVNEAMSDLKGPQNATNDHAIRDQICLVPWLGTHEIGNTGFRFVRIDLLDRDSFVQLKNIRAIFVHRDLDYKGSFRCSDERLNQIWQTGAYTVHLNMQDYLWDGIKRDRLVWVGDMHPEVMTIKSVFGAHEIIPDSLDLIRDETPLPAFMNGISSYSMWWILIHHSWYEYTGDINYLQQQRKYIKGLLLQLSEYIDADNREILPQLRFLDWPSSENPAAIHAGLHSMLVMTMEAGAELSGILNESDLQEKCLAASSRLKQHVPDAAGSKQAAALMAIAGVEDAGKLNNEVMALDGPHRMSTFYGYYVLQAQAIAGDYQGAINNIRDYWGAMLDLGATTFWEDFDVDWTENAARIDELVPYGKKDIHGDFGAYCYKGFRHSLCHGWASGPTAWLSEHVLGIIVIDPGCKTIKIEPHLGDLKWAEGTFPTPMGIITVKHTKKTNGTIDTKINAPKGIKILSD